MSPKGGDFDVSRVGVDLVFEAGVKGDAEGGSLDRLAKEGEHRGGEFVFYSELIFVGHVQTMEFSG